MTFNQGQSTKDFRRASNNHNNKKSVSLQAISATPTRATVSLLMSILTSVILTITGLLGLRFVTSMLGADHANYIHRLSQPLIIPFQGITHSNSRFDFTALGAIVLYSLVAWVILALMDPIGEK